MIAPRGSRRSPRFRSPSAWSLPLLLATAGCASASSVRLAGSEFAARPPTHPIAVYDALGDVDRPFLKVGRIVGTGSDEVAFAAVVAAMQQEARALGGDALVLDGVGPAAATSCGGGDRTVAGLCLRWR